MKLLPMCYGMITIFKAGPYIMDRQIGSTGTCN